MSLPTWVGLFRNGLCVLKDLAQSTYSVKNWVPALLMSKVLPLQEIVPGTLLIESLIGPLQSAAVLFNLQSGLHSFASGWISLHGLKQWREVLGRIKTTPVKALAEESFAQATVDAQDTLLSSPCLLACSFGFIWLALNSFHHTHVNLINYGNLYLQRIWLT